MKFPIFFTVSISWILNLALNFGCLKKHFYLFVSTILYAVLQLGERRNLLYAFLFFFTLVKHNLLNIGYFVRCNLVKIFKS